MSKTAAELLLEMDAKVEEAPWLVGMAKPWDIHCGHGTKARLTTRLFNGHASMAAEARAIVALRNALPQIAAVCEAAVASNEALVRTLGGRMSVSFTGKEIPNPARAMQHVTAFEAALADLTAALGEKA